MQQTSDGNQGVGNGLMSLNINMIDYSKWIWHASSQDSDRDIRWAFQRSWCTVYWFILHRHQTYIIILYITCRSARIAVLLSDSRTYSLYFGQMDIYIYIYGSTVEIIAWIMNSSCTNSIQFSIQTSRLFLFNSFTKVKHCVTWSFEHRERSKQLNYP